MWHLPDHEELELLAGGWPFGRLMEQRVTMPRRIHYWDGMDEGEVKLPAVASA